MNRFDFIERSSACQSGLTCLSMICRYYGRHVNLTASSSHYKSVEESLEQVSSNAEKLGLSSVIGYLPVTKLSKVTLPCLMYWDDKYYVILHKVKFNTYYVEFQF